MEQIGQLESRIEEYKNIAIASGIGGVVSLGVLTVGYIIDNELVKHFGMFNIGWNTSRLVYNYTRCRLSQYFATQHRKEP